MSRGRNYFEFHHFLLQEICSIASVYFSSAVEEIMQESVNPSPDKKDWELANLQPDGKNGQTSDGFLKGSEKLRFERRAGGYVTKV